jgi:predicted HTH domain antitoxin
METLQVELDVPRDLLGILNVTEEEAGPHLKKLIALELFREERISSGKAADLLGISKVEFIDLLDQHGIPYFTERPEEIASQVEAIREKVGEDSS